MARRGAALLAALALAAPAAARAEKAGGAVAATVAALEAMGNREAPEKQWEAARWIAARFAELGLAVELPAYGHAGRSWPNVVATLEGRERKGEVVILSAHLDSTASDSASRAPGADDDASGVAVVLELARRLRGVPLARTVRFAVFSNEEDGAAGSRAFARSARASGAAIAAVVNLDDLGYAGPSGADWEGLAGIGSLRVELRALGRVAANLARAALVPRRAVEVAGRPANAALVRAVAGRLRGDAGLRVEEVVKEDCG